MRRKRVKLYIGIDDTDSPLGGCTTYVGSRIAIELDKLNGVEFLDYPLLIRLNPNVPFKTRGNGAVVIKIEVEEKLLDRVKDTTIRILEESSELRHLKARPAVVFYRGKVGKDFVKLYYKALREMVALSFVMDFIKRHKIETFTIRGKRGIVGAVSAIGGLINDDYTFELLTYRSPENFGKLRKVNEKSLIEVDRRYRPYTFANYDYLERRALITPHGPDPVLYGIRGESPLVLLRMFKEIRVEEPIDMWVIFRTNQGTGIHFMYKDIEKIRPYDSVCVKGKVVGRLIRIKGGHLFFRLTNGNKSISCAVFKETGILKMVANLLREGDEVEVCGGIVPSSSKHDISLNVELLRVIKSLRVSYEAPRCPRCGRRMKSMGKNKGYKCPYCGYKDPSAKKIEKIKPSIIEPGIYISSPKAFRHLTKPMSRYGLEKKGDKVILIRPWHS